MTTRERCLSPGQRFAAESCQLKNGDLWPGSFLAHPVAFVMTSEDGVDEWAYGIVSVYTASTETTLHLVRQHGSTRLPLLSTTAVIKADVLNYVLQTGGGVNAAGLSPKSYSSSKTKSSLHANADAQVCRSPLRKT
ncbi:hypothetical protein PHYSODRAFT_354173 [Phytophthora sojae]|uniref:Uncharacterized protein n=1 Tax=Phytophthora sojae (strain P6497) TaxID=1094619 RepID=G4Z9M7_PHYSP|nr:hypothetical protein PHYSODRAFT_354173 [Phytophthora sojae]EGZ19141.1 hypothetical protein PHYSODRAFT_354173 [Phytophthora sojae]|eukprot:XP_009521858.1 hypothetical protein PHYSODRAFT_354173 [Phytophthora sojae]